METYRKISIEEAENFTPYLKDYLCERYSFIDRFKDSPKHKVDFSEQGITNAFAYRHGFGNTEKKVILTFLNNLEIIKYLYDNRPKYLVTRTYNIINNEGYIETITEEEITFGYDKLNYKGKYDKQAKISIKLIS